MSACLVCRAPTEPGSDYCAEHAFEASVARTEMVRLDELGVGDAPKPLPPPVPTGSLPAPGADEDLIATTARRIAEPVAAPPAPTPKKTPPSLGRVLGGRFEIKSHLGSGAFGATFVAFDQRLRRECVVKMLRPLSPDPTPFEVELRRRFGNEALTLAHLVHPHITQVFDHGEEPDGANWIAMEYVRGRSLADVGRAEKRLEPPRVARLGAQLAGALAFAHSRGIVHRDLKPDNVLVVDSASGGEQAKVLDFGIARITDPAAVGMEAGQAQLTSVGAFLGTPAFMSPEQAEGAPVGPPSDVYSLGVVLYLLVTGRLPGQVPEAWTPLTTIAYVMSPFEPVRKLRPDCPPALAETIEAMLVKPAPERHLSAGQIEAELAALSSPARRRASPNKPSRLGATIALVALVLAAAVAALLFFARHAPAPARPIASTAPHVDPHQALRNAAVELVLQNARAGKPAVLVDPEADALSKVAEDPRLELAKGLAHLTDRDFDGAASYLEKAAGAADAAVAREAGTALAEARAGREAAHAERPKPRPPPAPPAAERPDY